MGTGISHRRSRDRAVLTAALCAALVAAPARAAAPLVLHGTFALAGRTPAATATLTVVPEGPERARLALEERRDGALVTAYDVDMTKRLHLIAVSDDFATFVHEHPAYDGRGRFTIDLHVPHPGHYHIYADAVPHGVGQQVFRFDVPFGDAPDARPHLDPSGPVAHAGPYTVALDGTHLHAGSATLLHVRVTENGKPANDLHPYLGGAAHAVFLDARTLAYVHVHPMAQGSGSMTGMGSMSGMTGMGSTSGMTGMGSTSGMTGMGSTSSVNGEMHDLPADARVAPSMLLHVAVPSAGTYALWLQFRGGDRLWVAPFVLTAA